MTQESQRTPWRLDKTINPSVILTLLVLAGSGISFAFSVTSAMERDRYRLDTVERAQAQARQDRDNQRTEFLQALERSRIEQQAFNNKLESKIDAGLQKIDAKVDNGLREVRDDIRRATRAASQ